MYIMPYQRTAKAPAEKITGFICEGKFCHQSTKSVIKVVFLMIWGEKKFRTFEQIKI